MDVVDFVTKALNQAVGDISFASLAAAAAKPPDAAAADSYSSHALV